MIFVPRDGSSLLPACVRVMTFSPPGIYFGWNSSKSWLETTGKFDVDDVVLVRFPLVEAFFWLFSIIVKLEFAGDDLVSKGGYFTCCIRLKLLWGFSLVHAVWHNEHYKDSTRQKDDHFLFCCCNIFPFGIFHGQTSFLSTEKGLGLSCPIRPHYRWN